MQPVAVLLHEHVGLARPGVLGDVGEALGDHEVGHRLDRGRRAARHVHGQPDRDRHPRGHPGQGGIQAAVLEHRRVQAADQVAELGQGGLGLLVGLRDGLVRFLDGLGLGPGHAQVHGQGDQPLLGAVVQVPLQSAPLGVGGVDHAGPGLGETLHPVLQLLGPARAQQRLRGPDIQRRDPRGEPGRGDQQR